MPTYKKSKTTRGKRVITGRLVKYVSNYCAIFAPQKKEKKTSLFLSPSSLLLNQAFTFIMLYISDDDRGHVDIINFYDSSRK
jgi:hypothetical protein